MGPTALRLANWRYVKRAQDSVAVRSDKQVYEVARGVAVALGLQREVEVRTHVQQRP